MGSARVFLGVVCALLTPLVLQGQGRLPSCRIGDDRLSLVVDARTGLLAEVRVEGETLVVGSPSPDGAFGLKLANSSGTRVTPVAVTVEAPDLIRGEFVCGSNLHVSAYYQLRADLKAVRSWFEFKWTGSAPCKFDGFAQPLGDVPCSGGTARYFCPGAYPPRRYGQESWREGTERYGLFGSDSPIVLDTGRGWSVLACIDAARPYSDRGATFVRERRDGLSFHVYSASSGYARPSLPQRLGDFWLVFAKCGGEEMLNRIAAWHRAVGHRPPAGRPADVRDRVVYSTSPRGRAWWGARGINHWRTYLPYLAALGIDTVWMRPVNHFNNYTPDELYRLAKDLGTEEDLHRYVAAARELGFAVWHDAVSHGGLTANRRTQEHPEWVCKKEDGSFQDIYWAYDLRNPSWCECFGDWVEWFTRKYGLDGWRMDVPFGSRFPNWDPGVPYDRASFAQLQGGLAMTRAIRAAARRANPRAVTLGEANESHLATTCDVIYDQLLCHARFHDFSFRPAAEVVKDLMRWLEDQKRSFVPDTVWLRYPESHDSGDADCYYGRAAANAMMALCAWMDGIPMMWDESDARCFEDYRRILAIRKALPELRGGGVNYLDVPAPDGVLAFRRYAADNETRCYVNFNPHEVLVDGRLRLPPFGYEAVRTQGESVETCLARSGYRPDPYAGAAKGCVDAPRARLWSRGERPMPLDCRIRTERTAAGVRYAVADLKGARPRDVQLVLQLPKVGRWYARAAEGTFNGPFFVQDPKTVSRQTYGARTKLGGELWSSELYPFGFVRAHASVGGVAGETACECFGFAPTADVRLLDRIGGEEGFAVSVAGDAIADLVLETETLPVAAAALGQSSGTGDDRLFPIVGGWRYETGEVRVDVSRTGAIVGAWKREADGHWTRKLGLMQVQLRAGDAPALVKYDRTGRDRHAMEQLYAAEPHARLLRRRDGTLQLNIDGGLVRGLESNSRNPSARILTQNEIVFPRTGGDVGYLVKLTGDADLKKGDWSVVVRANIPPAGAQVEVVRSDGVPYDRVHRQDGRVDVVYHDGASADYRLAPGTGSRVEFAIRIR